MVTWVYMLTMGLAIGSCTLLLKWFQRDLAIPYRQKLALGICAFIGAMLGAKIPFFIYEITGLPDHSEHLGWITSWFANGKTIMFGIVGGYLAVEIAKATLKIKVRTGDSFAVPVAVGVAIGRLACLAAGCCHGAPTELPWGIHYQVVDGNSDLLRHPTQIYEFLFHAFSATWLFAAFRQFYWKPPRERGKFEIVFWGNLLKAYLVSYLLYRLFTEEIRPEPEIAAGLTVYQLTAICLLPVFLFLWGSDVIRRLQRIRNSGQPSV